MSELTRCNYCKYMDIVSDAKRQGRDVVLKADDSNILPSKGARGAYIDGEFQAWFMEIPSSCAC